MGDRSNKFNLDAPRPEREESKKDDNHYDGLFNS